MRSLNASTAAPLITPSGLPPRALPMQGAVLSPRPAPMGAAAPAPSHRPAVSSGAPRRGSAHAQPHQDPPDRARRRRPDRRASRAGLRGIPAVGTGPAGRLLHPGDATTPNHTRSRGRICPTGWAADNGDPSAPVDAADQLNRDEFASSCNSGGVSTVEGGIRPTLLPGGTTLPEMRALVLAADRLCFVVAGQAPAPHQPGERPLDDPTAGSTRKPWVSSLRLTTSRRRPSSWAGPVDEVPGVAAVGPDQL